MGIATTVMTYGTNFGRGGHQHGDKSRLAFVEDYGTGRQCNASPEDGIYNNNNNNSKVNHNNSKNHNSKLKCPASISRLRVEKIEGGLMVAGVVVAANCQLALPAFGFLFMLVGAVLTAASYRGPGVDEDLNSYAARIAFTGNSRVLGPICMVVGGLMLGLGALLCALTRRARRRERRVGFHCPLHGDFYPLSPVHAAKMLGKNGDKDGWTRMIPCFRSCKCSLRSKDEAVKMPPQCPHSVLSSTRSSVSSSPLSPCPTPMPFLVTSNSMSGMVHIGGVAAAMSPDQNFGSIRSLSVTREIASFPLSRTPTPPSRHRLVSSSTSYDEEAVPTAVINVIPDSPAKLEPEVVVSTVPVLPARKSVSIVLPEEQVQQHMG